MKVERKLHNWAQTVQSKNRGKANELLIQQRGEMRDVPKINESSRLIAQDRMKGQLDKATQPAKRSRSGADKDTLKHAGRDGMTVHVNLSLRNCHVKLKFTPEGTVAKKDLDTVDANKEQRDLYEAIVWGQQCSESIVRPVEYSSISPSKAVLSYSAGMDYDTFKKRARPVVTYKRP